MTFSPKYLRIIGGHIDSYKDDGKLVSKMKFVINNWPYKKKINKIVKNQYDSQSHLDLI